ncbi:hypothetical protein GCM10008941_15330 [Rhizomicrobium palustre]
MRHHKERRKLAISPGQVKSPLGGGSKELNPLAAQGYFTFWREGPGLVAQAGKWRTAPGGLKLS